MFDVSYRKTNGDGGIGSTRLTENDLKSEDSFAAAFQNIAKTLKSGTYTVYDGKGIFARVDVKDNRLARIHRWSENTGILLPCWKHFS
jgi:hypothetical protein